jgi:hypothetical protein
MAEIVIVSRGFTKGLKKRELRGTDLPKQKVRE